VRLPFFATVDEGQWLRLNIGTEPNDRRFRFYFG